MNRKTKRIVNIVLTLLLVFCLVMLVKSIVEDTSSRQDYEEASMLAGNAEETEAVEETMAEAPEETEPAPAETQPREPAPIPDDPHIHQLMETDLEALRAENEDVVGWITIPDTLVNYPLMQWTDNKFYLSHTWKQTRNPNGSIFIEWQNSRDLTDFNTIIYGHNMAGGAMFGTLRHFKKQEHWEAHPSFYIACDRGVLRYDIFAVHSAGVDTIIYGLELDTDQKRKEFLRFAKDYSYYDTGIEPTIDDHIVTLSTCTGRSYSSRWVVQGVLNVEGSYWAEP